MNDLDVDAIVAGYVDRMPAARESLMRDPLFHAHVTWLRTIGPVLDRALAAEGLDGEARGRIINTIVYGDPDPEKVVRQLVEYEARLARAQDRVLGDLTAGREFTGLTELLGNDQPPSVPRAGTVLTAADPEPPMGTRVRDDCGVEWVNDGHRPVCWVQPDADVHDPESWMKVAGNYGPVTVLGEGDR